MAPSPSGSRSCAASSPSDLPIAIERPSGLLVDALVEAGHPVVPIDPNAVKASRPRYRASGAKNDSGDARLLADLPRTASRRCSRNPTRSRHCVPSCVAAMTGRHSRATRQSASRPARWLLAGAAAIFAAIDSAIALAFVARYPTPEAAQRLGEKRLAAFLAQHNYSGRAGARPNCSPACAPRPAVCQGRGKRQGRDPPRAGRNARAPAHPDRRADRAHSTRRRGSARGQAGDVLSARRANLRSRDRRRTRLHARALSLARGAGHGSRLRAGHQAIRQEPRSLCRST